MNCPYSENCFATALQTESARQKICTHCKLKSLSKGQLITVGYWSDAFTVLVDGLIVAGYQDYEDGQYLVTGMVSSGAIVGNANLFPDIPLEMFNRHVYCVVKCMTAVFDRDFIRELMTEYPAMEKHIMHQSIKVYWYEKEAFIHAICGRDTYQAVRYVVKYCNERKISPLTHAQIALICNRARPTVTNVLKKLVQKEPDLFSYWN